MNNDQQPIQTRYNGYYFRSRTEARWAVFFDSLGVKYQYEPEGYKLKNGDWYLPDFLVTNLDGHSGFFEVKPSLKVDQTWMDKLEYLYEQTDTNVFLLNGPPDYKFYRCFGAYFDDPEECSWCSICFFPKDIRNSIDDLKNFRDESMEGAKVKQFFQEKYIKAVNASRAARF